MTFDPVHQGASLTVCHLAPGARAGHGRRAVELAHPATWLGVLTHRRLEVLPQSLAPAMPERCASSPEGADVDESRAAVEDNGMHTMGRIRGSTSSRGCRARARGPVHGALNSLVSGRADFLGQSVRGC